MAAQRTKTVLCAVFFSNTSVFQFSRPLFEKPH